MVGKPHSDGERAASMSDSRRRSMSPIEGLRLPRFAMAAAKGRSDRAAGARTRPAEFKVNCSLLRGKVGASGSLAGTRDPSRDRDQEASTNCGPAAVSSAAGNQRARAFAGRDRSEPSRGEASPISADLHAGPCSAQTLAARQEASRLPTGFSSTSLKPAPRGARRRPARTPTSTHHRRTLAAAGPPRRYSGPPRRAGPKRSAVPSAAESRADPPSGESRL